jgi:hypothetical protein
MKGTIMKNVIRYLLLFFVLGLSVTHLYADEYADDTTSSHRLVQRHEESGIVYVNGGVGDEQRKELKEARKDFNLQMTFAEKHTGTYIADVDVDIETMAGREMLSLSNIGPIFMAQLPAGKYRIKATSGDKTLTKTVYVGKKGIRDLYFYWYR